MAVVRGCHCSAICDMLNGQEFGCERRGVKRMTRIKDGSSTDVTDIDTSSPTV